MKRIISLLLILLLCGCGRPPGETAGLNSEKDRQWYLNEQGLEAAEAPISVQEVKLPETFPPVLVRYNQLQLKQGFDLNRYSGKYVTVYTYELCGSEGGQLRFASLYLYKGRLIGGDIHSAALNGYIGPIRATENG